MSLQIIRPIVVTFLIGATLGFVYSGNIEGAAYCSCFVGGYVFTMLTLEL